MTVKGLCLLVLIALIAVAIDLASRPPRIETKETLFQGITYTRLIRSTPRPLVIHIVDIDLTSPGIRILVSPGNPHCGLESCAMTTGAFLEKNHLQLAINGSFFLPFYVGETFWDYYPHTNDPVDIQGLAISKSVQYSEDDDRFAKICFTKMDALITENTCPEVTIQALAGREIIVQNRIAVNFGYDDGLNPRTAVAVGDEGKRLWLIVVDGRQDGYSEGMNLNELATLAVQLGATEALNLDGGGSTTLVVSKNGIHTLNSPIHTRIPMRQRPVANHLGVYAMPQVQP
jgi:hypothetical protein